MCFYKIILVFSLIRFFKELASNVTILLLSPGETGGAFGSSHHLNMNTVDIQVSKYKKRGISTGALVPESSLER